MRLHIRPNARPNACRPARLGSGVVVAALLAAAPFAAPPAAAAPPSDACALLSQAEVAAATGSAVGPGTHVTPTFTRTCTWSGTGGGSVASVTLFLQDAASYDGGKRLVGMTNKMTFTPLHGVGDYAYYAGAGPTVGLMVKKGAMAFKVGLYGQLPPDRKMAVEKVLAGKVAARL